MKHKQELGKAITKVYLKLIAEMNGNRIPSGDLLREYFNLYDGFRNHRASHMIPKGAKNFKYRLIRFLIDSMKLPARVSKDPIERTFDNRVSDAQKATHVITIGFSDREFVAFHVTDDQIGSLQTFNKEILPNPRNKRFICDFFNRLHEQDIKTATAFVNQHQHIDYFGIYLKDGRAQ